MISVPEIQKELRHQMTVNHFLFVYVDKLGVQLYITMGFP